MSIIWSDRKRTLFGLPLSFTKYTLTDERLIIDAGFLNKREDEVRLYRITDVSLRRSLGQRMFGVGTIHCCSGDKTLGDFDVLNVKNSREVKELLSDQIEKQRDAKRVTSREFIGGSTDAFDGYDDIDDGNDEDSDE